MPMGSARSPDARQLACAFRDAASRIFLPPAFRSAGVSVDTCVAYCNSETVEVSMMQILPEQRPIATERHPCALRRVCNHFVEHAAAAVVGSIIRAAVGIIGNPADGLSDRAVWQRVHCRADRRRDHLVAPGDLSIKRTAAIKTGPA